MDKSLLVATSAEVHMKAIVPTSTATEVPMDESSLVATTAEVQMKALVATTATVSLVEKVNLVQLATITKLQKQQDNYFIIKLLE